MNVKMMTKYHRELIYPYLFYSLGRIKSILKSNHHCSKLVKDEDAVY